MIIDLMQGKTLTEELETMRIKKQKMSITTIQSIMYQLLKGVQNMHEKKVLTISFIQLRLSIVILSPITSCLKNLEIINPYELWTSDWPPSQMSTNTLSQNAERPDMLPRKYSTCRIKLKNIVQSVISSVVVAFSINCKLYLPFYLK